MSSIIANPLLAGFIVLTIISIVLLCLVIRMHLKLRKFLVGMDSDDIESSLQSVGKGLADYQRFRAEMEEYLMSVEKRLRQSVQSVHTVRFNPFKGTGGGGNQSFATALLNEDGDGVIISSLYSRDHVSVFAKPVKGSQTEHELSEEEDEALKHAKGKLRLK